MRKTAGGTRAGGSGSARWPGGATAAALVSAALVVGCGGGGASGNPGVLRAPGDTARLVAAPDSFRAPQAVHYDENQDIYFVANMNGAPDAADNNGFISRLRPDGVIEQLRFIAGGQSGVTLHAPRGMTIVGDTLWVVDVDAVRGFDRRTGLDIATVDINDPEPVFLNDISAGPGGVLYITDTRANRLYRIVGRSVDVALTDTTLGAPNGIAWDAANRRFIIAPYGGKHVIFGWKPGSIVLNEVGRSSAGAAFDGVELLPGEAMVVASQADSTIQLFSHGEGGPLIRLSGRPADIGYDPRRNRLAVPFMAHNTVQLWQLPALLR